MIHGTSSASRQPPRFARENFKLGIEIRVTKGVLVPETEHEFSACSINLTLLSRRNLARIVPD